MDGAPAAVVDEKAGDAIRVSGERGWKGKEKNRKLGFGWLILRDAGIYTR